MSPGQMTTHVSEDKNAVLTAPYSEDEVRMDVLQIEHNMNPCNNDGFPGKF